MDNMQKFGRQISLAIFAGILSVSGGALLLWWVTTKYLELNVFISASLVVILLVCSAIIFSNLISGLVSKPLNLISQALMHVSSTNSTGPAPDPQLLKHGRELVSNLIMQIYQLAAASQAAEEVNQKKHESIGQAATIAQNLPLPVFVMDKDLTVRYANAAALQYCAAESSAVLGQNLYSVLDLSFSTDSTFETWLKLCREHTVKANQTWERVRLKVKDQPGYKQLDLAASYDKDSPSGIESIITLFDRSELYDKDDQNLSFISLAVHELRTPLTAMRGYVEVFEDELGSSLSAEHKDFMHKMKASSEALSNFVGNILNVARIEANQLTLKLEEEKWPEVLNSAVDVMKLQAQVHGKELKIELAPDLPTAAVDRISIYEVVSNLIDNAIKYSGDKSKQIIIRSRLNQEGLIETTVQDFGVGIDSAVIPNLFEKFYRNHRTRAQIGGTGLGLYLSKAIISAHGGNIWVRSHEGEGSTFGFTLLPYSQLADELKNTDNKAVTRSAYGWIKNHSLYRR